MRRVVTRSIESKLMKIAHRYISSAHPPLVIAEIGINHGGSLDVAKSMVLAAH